MRTMSTMRLALAGTVVLLWGCMSDSGLSSNGAGGTVVGGGSAGFKASGGAGAGGADASSGGAAPSRDAGGSAAGAPGAGGATAGTAGRGGNSLGGGGTTTAVGGHGGSGGTAGAGIISTGGLGGRNDGSGGVVICPAIACVVPRCPYGEQPGPPPCGCPICAPAPDGGAGVDGPSGWDAAVSADAPMICTASCAHPTDCPNGTVEGPPPCNCPICAAGDAGQRGDGPAGDGPMVCAMIACPMIACRDGYVPSPTPCACPSCAPVDGADGEVAGAACGAAADPPCASGMHCEWSDKLCGARTHGACTSFPGGGVMCAVSAAPVCGCDGKNYPSPCEAARNGVDVSSNASCPEPAGMFRCGWSYCQHGAEYCHATVGGAITSPGSYACNPLPAACSGSASCACITGGAAMCDANANGDVTVTLAVP